MVKAIARQSAPKDEKTAEPLNTFVARIMTLLNMGDLVLESEPRVAPLQTILETTLRPFVAKPERITIDGPPAALVEEAAGALALAMHELATNAMKYGALSTSGGTISVKWTRDGDHVALVWKEKDGPRVSQPVKEGFGMRVVRQGAHGGRADVAFEPDGLCCRLTVTVVDLPGRK